MFARVDLEALSPRRDVSRRVKPRCTDATAFKHAFDETTTLTRKRSPCFAPELLSQRFAKNELFHCRTGGEGGAVFT